MKTYLLTSPQFEGEIELQYDDTLQLISLQIRATLTPGQHRWFTQILPSTLPELKSILKVKQSSAILTEVVFIPSFEDFWNRYDDKQLSSRKRAMSKWDRMSKNQRIKAYNFIQTYFSGIPSGIRKKYAETYLNAELWNN